MRHVWTLVPLVLFSSVGAVADDQFTAQYCNAAFSQGISDHYELLTTLQQYQSFQQRFCDANFTSRSSISSSDINGGVTIPIADVLLGLSGSDDQKNAQFEVAYHTFCSQTASTLDINQRFSAIQTQVDSALVQGWNTCIHDQINGYLQSHGVFLSISPNGNWDDFNARITVRDDLVNQIVIKNIAPNGLVQCTYQGTPIVPNKTKIDLKTFDLTCTKSFDRDLTMSVSTSNGSSDQRDVPSGTSKITELVNQIALLSAGLQGANAQISNLSQALSSLPKPIKVLTGDSSVGPIDGNQTTFVPLPPGTFSSPPSVVVSINHIENPNGNVRVDVQPANITVSGFNVNFSEWQGSNSPYIHIYWVAVGH